MDLIISYFPIIIVIIAIITVSGVAIVNFSKKTKEEKLNSIQQWAIYACAVAEADLGSGTGKLKMRETYDMFLERFPKMADKISFETYEVVAELALKEFKKMLEENPNVQDIIIKQEQEKYGVIHSN